MSPGLPYDKKRTGVPFLAKKYVIDLQRSESGFRVNLEQWF
jgi:hypothetical protein